MALRAAILSALSPLCAAAAGIEPRLKPHRVPHRPAGLGRGPISAQPEANGRELDEGEEVCSALLVSGRDAPTVSDPVEEPFDEAPIPLEVWTEADRISPVASRRDVRPASTRGDELPDSV